MRLEIDLSAPTLQGDPLALAHIVRGFLFGMVAYDRYLIRTRQVPRIYDAFWDGKLQFQNEPWAGQGKEEIADALTCIRRGWGDCDDLAPWRTAELQEEGVRAGLKIYQRGKVFHVETRLPNGDAEDVSRYLGMKGRRPGAVGMNL